MPKPKRGRYTAEQRTAIRERAVEVTLLQAETGLRISEACRLTRADVDADADPLTVTVTPGVSKTHRGRTVPVMDPRVAIACANGSPRLLGRPQRPFSGPRLPRSEFGTPRTARRP